jgi:hypothetical protein
VQHNVIKLYCRHSRLRGNDGVRTGVIATRLDPRFRTTEAEPELAMAGEPVPAWGEGGAACQTRTDDPIITNDVLYRLS